MDKNFLYLLLYALPLTALSMLLDFHTGNASQYLIVFIFHLLLAVVLMKRSNAFWVMLGNFIGGLTSSVVMYFSQDHSFFFKPFGDVGTVWFFVILSTVIQLLIAWAWLTWRKTRNVR